MLDNRPPKVSFGLYRRIALAGVLIFVFTAAGVATASLMRVKRTVGILKEYGHVAKFKKDTITPTYSGKAQTLLLVGSDKRFGWKNDESRSDTMMLLRLDPKQKATAVLNIPRDLKVLIPGHGMEKINASYSYGGVDLVARTIKSIMPGIKINHAIEVNFKGFREAVNFVGCVYTDVDRRYYHSNAGLPPSAQYAEIDIQPGYQRLCGQKALDYVRFRHLDNDFVRAARQQDFLRQAKDQIGLTRLVKDRKQLLSIVGRYTQTDIRDEGALLRLIKLALSSARNPLREVHFDADQSGDYLTITPKNLKRDVGEFLGSTPTAGGRGKVTKSSRDRARERSQKRKSRKQSVPAGVFRDVKTPENTGIMMGAKLPFPVYYPGFTAVGSNYQLTQARAYDIFDRDKKRHRAYRYVVSAPGLGQYYGIEGTNWKDPPILDGSYDTQKMSGRDYRVYYDGQHVRLVALVTPNAVYWVSNTLLQSLTNKQMLAIAGSLRRVGS